MKWEEKKGRNFWYKKERLSCHRFLHVSKWTRQHKVFRDGPSDIFESGVKISTGYTSTRNIFRLYSIPGVILNSPYHSREPVLSLKRRSFTSIFWPCDSFCLIWYLNIKVYAPYVYQHLFILEYITAWRVSFPNLIALRCSYKK